MGLRRYLNKYIVYPSLDVIDLWSGRRDPLAPPRSKVFTGTGDFKAIGDTHLGYFIRFCDLKPHQRVLEVGSGIGRMAIPLTKYLSADGSYEGFDIVKDGVQWCQKKITKRYPNFRFQLSDIHNTSYNPRGKHQATDYRFPFEDGAFDLVILTSVFTHMLQPEVEHYLHEIARVLKRNGRCFITYFLLNEESLRLIEAGKSVLAFPHVFGSYRTANLRKPEDAAAYDESYLRALYGKTGLRIDEPPQYGSWCGRERYLSMQDVIIATKA